MGNTLAQDRFAVPEPFLGTHQFGLKLLEVGSTKVLEFAPLEQIPHAFLWIEFGSIPRQSLQVDAFGSACGQEILDSLRAMNARAIPDDQQFPRDLAHKQLQEAHDVWSFERPILDMHDQASIHGQTSHGREMITGQRDLQDGRLSHGSIGAHGYGQQIKTCLIYKDNGAFLLFGLFLARRNGGRATPGSPVHPALLRAFLVFVDCA